MESARESFDIFLNAEGCLDGIQKFAERVFPFVGKRFLATVEDDLDLHFVSAREEFFRLRSLEIEVVRVGAEANSDALGLNFLLLALRFLFLFSFGVEVFAVVENFADGGRCLGRHLHEIELLLFGAGNRLLGWHVLRYRPIRINDKHKRHANMFVDARLGELNNLRPGSSVSSSTHLCIQKNQWS